MAKNLIDVGINLNDGTGDNLRTAGTKINAMFQEVYDVFGDGSNLSNIVSNLHIVNDIAPQLGGNLDMNGYIINGNGSINITSTITTGNNLVAVGAVQASTAAITNNSTFGGTVTVGGTVFVGNHATIKTTITDTSLTTGTLNATTELQVIGPASITGAITSGAVGSKMRFYWNNVAAFPSATTYEGGLAFAEDTNRMYFASDTEWYKLAPEEAPQLTNRVVDSAIVSTPTAPTAVKTTNTTQIATTAYVKDVVSDYAPLDSPTLTGVPLTPTQGTGTRATPVVSTQIANSTYVRAVASEIYTEVDLKSPIANPTFTGIPRAPTAADDINTTQIATTAFVRAREDIINTALTFKAPKASPTFTGTPAAPTATAGTNTTQLSTTAFVTVAINNYSGTVDTALSFKSPLASPFFTGVPRAPTAASSVSDTQIASTAYVGDRIDAKLASPDYLDDKLSAYAKKASPALTGTPTAPTAADGTNNTQIASTAFVNTAINTKITAVDLSQYAPKASPTLTGTPAAPTASLGTNTTQIASTAFVKNAIDAYSGSSNLGQYAPIDNPVFTGTPTVPTAPVNDNTLKIANTEWVQREFGYASVPKWGGSKKYVSTAAPTSSDGVDGDIWFQISS